MPISDVYTAHFTPTVAATTVTPAGSLISPATKRAWVVGVRVKILSTAAVAGFNTLFQLARPNATNTVLKDRKSTRLNSSHQIISYAVFCLKKKKRHNQDLGHHELITPTCRFQVLPYS